MMIIEFRQAAYNKAFDLLDAVKDYGKKAKMTLCALEDALEECYEASMDSEEDEELEVPTEDKEEDFEMNYRGHGSRSAMRRNMRMRYRDGMHSNMRMRMRNSAR